MVIDGFHTSSNGQKSCVRLSEIVPMAFVTRLFSPMTSLDRTDNIPISISINHLFSEETKIRYWISNVITNRMQSEWSFTQIHSSQRTQMKIPQRRRHFNYFPSSAEAEHTQKNSCSAEFDEAHAFERHQSFAISRTYLKASTFKFGTNQNVNMCESPPTTYLHTWQLLT